MTTSRRTATSIALAFALLSAACSRGVNQERLTRDLQSRLDSGVKADLFKVVALRREGSAPLPAQAGQPPRVIVYYNATLKLDQDYSFGGWDQLAPSTVAFALGAKEKGIFGLQPANHAGDLVRAYGSAVYEQAGNDWKLVAAAPTETAAAPNFEGTAPPSRSKQLIDQLAAMIELPPPGVPPQQDDIIADELSRASENIERRVQRRQRTFTLASGPSDGDYARTATAIVDAVHRAAPDVSLRQRNSDGSVENALLIARGDADYAIIQGDVAAAAMAGGDSFSQAGPLTMLRAVGGLYPEAIHVVVLPDSPIRDISELRGKRVNLGPTASGTRFDAIGVLAAYDIKPGDLKEARSDQLTAAITRLQRKQVDVLFVTASAPTRLLQQLAVETGFRLLPIGGAATDQIITTRPGLSRLTLPANTYPKQKGAVTTLASAALLVTTADAPEGEVARIANLVFFQIPQERSGADVVKVSADNELRGITIPLHAGAAKRQK